MEGIMPEPQQARAMGWGEALGLLLLVAAVGLMVWPAVQTPETALPVPRGTPLPPLMVAGWLDGSGPTRESLEGRVVVIDCWATWCVPCRAAMPKLAKLYKQYRPLGVEFVGLTPEGEAELPAIGQFLKSVGGVNWPIGYGANPTFNLLGIAGYPTLIVFDEAGRAVWSGKDLDAMTEALDQVLALRK